MGSACWAEDSVAKPALYKGRKKAFEIQVNFRIATAAESHQGTPL